VSAACCKQAEQFWLNDLNAPLMNLLEMIVNHPDRIADEYEMLWRQQLGREKHYYLEIRDRFNATHQPSLLLYLLARCVKASVRYNSRGEFNQGPDNRRKGRTPASMRSEIFKLSHLLRNRTTITSHHYSDVVDLINPGRDVVYLDPPYQGTSTNRDPRYLKSLDVGELIDYLQDLNAHQVMYALSYDGHKAGKHYGIKLPKQLDLYRVEINAGRSSQSTLLGQNHFTFESLYLSPALISQVQPKGARNHLQLALLP
jgi:DNA adenine methylase